MLTQFHNVQTGNSSTTGRNRRLSTDLRLELSLLIRLGTEPFELERLIVSDDEIDDVEDLTMDGEDDELSYRPVLRSSRGRVARAVSLCLLNKIQMGQLYWPETSGVARYSIPQHVDRYRQLPAVSRVMLGQANQNSADLRTPHLHSALSTSIGNRRSLSSNIDYFFDDLTGLDQIRLDQLRETDLVSTSNG